MKMILHAFFPVFFWYFLLPNWNSSNKINAQLSSTLKSTLYFSYNNLSTFYPFPPSSPRISCLFSSHLPLHATYTAVDEADTSPSPSPLVSAAASTSASSTRHSHPVIARNASTLRLSSFASACFAAAILA